MNSSPFRKFGRLLAVLALGSLWSQANFAALPPAATTFQNPYELVGGTDSSQSQTVITFTAASDGTLQGYFVGGITTGGNPVGFQNSVGVLLGTPPAQSLSTANTMPSGVTFCAPNNSANFGDTLFGSNCNGIGVTKGQVITFVLAANQLNVTNCCGVMPVQDKSAHYIWSNESATPQVNTAWDYKGNPTAATTSVAFSPDPGTTPATLPVVNDGTTTVKPTNVNSFTAQAPAGYNAMTYVASVNVGAGGLTGDTSCTAAGGASRDCIPASRNVQNSTNPIGAGTYTFVGFNDWLGGPSNSYFDYAFLFNIVPSSGNTTPEPGSMALVLLALMAAYGLRRGRGRIAMPAQV